MNPEGILLNIQKHVSLNEEEKAHLDTLFAIESFAKQHTILEQGRLCRKLFYVEKGSLRAFNGNQYGKESTIMFAIKDWWITDMYAFTNQTKALLSIETLEHCLLRSISFDVLEHLLLTMPKMERLFRILFQKAYVREQLRVLDNISLSTEERYLQFLSKYPQIAKKVTQKQIASYLGVTPEFLSSVKRK
ncbi:Crp/Fnr family transcriptional regulator [uncultured Croceitalea sp.]|uniref:Crp/Fnr family transcriptional regulator n=1 Tax=uncultured Croceitalea sp. TaxID=1798908 RepID=UPI003305F73E